MRIVLPRALHEHMSARGARRTRAALRARREGKTFALLNGHLQQVPPTEDVMV